MRVIANLVLVAHTERYLSANRSFLEHEVVQRPKLGNWKVPPPGQSGLGGSRARRVVFPRLCTGRATIPPQARPTARSPPSQSPSSRTVRFFYFEAYSLAFNVFEFPDGLLDDIDGILDGTGQEGRSVERLLRANSVKR